MKPSILSMNTNLIFSSLLCSHLQTNYSKTFQRGNVDFLETPEIITTMLVPGESIHYSSCLILTPYNTQTYQHLIRLNQFSLSKLCVTCSASGQKNALNFKFKPRYLFQKDNRMLCSERNPRICRSKPVTWTNIDLEKVV